MGQWEQLGVGVGAWSAAYGILRVTFPKRSHDFINRCVSVLHVFVAIYLCMLSVADWSEPLHGVGNPSSPLQMQAITVSLAYFIYDLLCCLLADTVDYTNIVHHLLSILGLAFGFGYGSCGVELVACLWLMELSNPFMHARNLMRELGIKDSPINLINDVSFLMTFTIARMVIGPYVVAKTLEADSPLAVKIGAVGIQVVSILWFYKIIRIMMHKVSKKTKEV